MRNHAAEEVDIDPCYAFDTTSREQYAARVAVPERVARSLAEEALAALATVAGKAGGKAGGKGGEKAEGNAGGNAGGKARPRAPHPTEVEIDRLCDALVSEDPGAAARLIARAQGAGVAPDTLYLGYIADSARRLGERWTDDRASFVDVTVGLGRLHGILRDLGPVFFSCEPVEVIGLDALFAAAPGETHILGVVMATDFFRRRGWHVDVDTGPTAESLVSSAAQRAYAVIGLSASSRRMIDPLARVVSELRPACPGALIVIGGQINELEPDIARMTGADVNAGDAPRAARSLEQMLETQTR